MRRIEKEHLLRILKDLRTKHLLIKQYCTNITAHHSLLVQCQECAIRIGNSIELSENEETVIISLIQQYCELVYEISLLNNCSEESLSNLNSILLKIEQKLSLIEVKDTVEIVFFVYNASMWDCLESVWLAANKDLNCRCFVIPIPYFDKALDGTLTTMYLENNKLPDYVPVVSWENYSIEDRRPDIAYIHNPYDQYNKVTSIHPDFYVDNLKKYINKVIYIPYFLAATQYNTIEEAVKRGEENVMPILFKVDKIIVQSQAYKDMLLCNKILKEKIEVLGSPKVDGVINYRTHLDEIPASWSKKCLNKKVILLNSSLRDMINKKNYIELICRIFEEILTSDSLILIWRLHPLYKNTLQQMRPELFDIVEGLVKIARNNPSFILDELTSFYPSFLISDAMISDTSSLARIYLFTQKPIYYLYGSKNNKKLYYSLNYFESYFRLDDLSIIDFLNMVVTGLDVNKNERIKAAFESIENTNGKCGEEVHKRILNGYLLEKRNFSGE